MSEVKCFTFMLTLLSQLNQVKHCCITCDVSACLHLLLGMCANTYMWYIACGNTYLCDTWYVYKCTHILCGMRINICLYYMAMVCANRCMNYMAYAHLHMYTCIPWHMNTHMLLLNIMRANIWMCCMVCMFPYVFDTCQFYSVYI